MSTLLVIMASSPFPQVNNMIPSRLLLEETRLRVTQVVVVAAVVEIWEE